MLPGQTLNATLVNGRFGHVAEAAFPHFYSRQSATIHTLMNIRLLIFILSGALPLSNYAYADTAGSEYIAVSPTADYVISSKNHTTQDETSEVEPLDDFIFMDDIFIDHIISGEIFRDEESMVEESLPEESLDKIFPVIDKFPKNLEELGEIQPKEIPFGVASKYLLQIKNAIRYRCGIGIRYWAIGRVVYNYNVFLLYGRTNGYEAEVYLCLDPKENPYPPTLKIYQNFNSECDIEFFIDNDTITIAEYTEQPGEPLERRTTYKLDSDFTQVGPSVSKRVVSRYSSDVELSNRYYHTRIKRRGIYKGKY